MIDNTDITHTIQKHILSVLLHQEIARFRDMRPDRVDTNLYSYHLKLLLKRGIIEKNELGYTLGARGMMYVDRVNEETLFVRRQPKIVTMLILQNDYGDVLLQKRTKQPYINAWSLPHGKLHVEDTSVVDAARREASEKLGVDNATVEHAGDCYIRVRFDKDITLATLAHVFRVRAEDTMTTVNSDLFQWVRLRELHHHKTAPAVEQIIARTFFGHDYFFEEYDIDW